MTNAQEVARRFPRCLINDDARRVKGWRNGARISLAIAFASESIAISKAVIIILALPPRIIFLTLMRLAPLPLGPYRRKKTDPEALRVYGYQCRSPRGTASSLNALDTVRIVTPFETCQRGDENSISAAKRGDPRDVNPYESICITQSAKQ